MTTIVSKKQLVKFAPRGEENFYDTMKAKVDEYFKSNNIKEHANGAMYLKTVVMLSIYFVPYLLIVTGLAAAQTWLFYIMWGVMGAGIVGIGTSVMHDSNHGSYSTNKFVNSTLGNVLNLLGGYARNWRIQHNVLHHTYTNLDGLDEDIDAGPLIRMSPHKPLLGIHRFQYIYAWFLYCIMNLFWISVKDYRQIMRYHKAGLLKKEKVTVQQALTELTLLKVFYIAYVIVLPLIFSNMPWYHVVGGFILMHVIAGLALACIFQPAHVIDTSVYPLPSPEHKMEDNWAAHQLQNTANFAPKSKITAWFIGGLNYQVEHHLFPHICHIHYPQIAGIVEEVALSHGMPYHVMPTFADALKEHGHMLKILGRKSD